MENEEEAERPRPKVIDKRISARSQDEVASEAPASEPEPEPTPAPPAEEPPAQAEPPGDDPSLWTPEQEAEAARLAQQVAQTPSLEWVVNVAVTLANVAGTKLDLGATADAQLAIDGLAAIVERLGPRLDRAEAPLRETLAQLQLAYAERAAPPPSAPG